MPYIPQEVRDIKLHVAITPGELNYRITAMCVNYLHTHGTNYRNLNEIIGVLECAKQEFYRRVVASYEDRKCEENGDVYQ